MIDPVRRLLCCLRCGFDSIAEHWCWKPNMQGKILGEFQELHGIASNAHGAFPRRIIEA